MLAVCLCLAADTGLAGADTLLACQPSLALTAGATAPIIAALFFLAVGCAARVLMTNLILGTTFTAALRIETLTLVAHARREISTVTTACGLSTAEAQRVTGVGFVVAIVNGHTEVDSFIFVAPPPLDPERTGAVFLPSWKTCRRRA